MPKEPERPENLIDRFPTRGGSWVDVVWGTTEFPTSSTTVYYWVCRASCNTSSQGSSIDDRSEALSQARSHAGTCTAAHRA